MMDTIVNKMCKDIDVIVECLHRYKSNLLCGVDMCADNYPPECINAIPHNIFEPDILCQKINILIQDYNRLKDGKTEKIS